jgi:transcriptional regulator with XRE-family HTH domain
MSRRLPQRAFILEGTMIQERVVLMQDRELRKAFGVRVKSLRKQRKWTQKELASKLGVRFTQLNKYECGLHVPPAEKLVEMAEVLDCTVDYLLTGNGSDHKPLHNTRLLERFRAVERFQQGDQEAIITVIDAMIVKHRVEGALEPVGKRAR